MDRSADDLGLLTLKPKLLSNGSDQASIRRQLLTSLIENVQECQMRFGGKKELATGDDKRVKKLCLAWEEVINSGLRSHYRLLSPNADVDRGLLESTSDRPEFWKLLIDKLGASSIDRYRRLKHVQSNTGRVRAWIRSCLNDKSLEKYLKTLLSDAQLLAQYYEDWAVLRQADHSQLLHLASGLASVAFAIIIDDSSLDLPASPMSPSSPVADAFKGKLSTPGGTNMQSELSTLNPKLHKKLSASHRSHSLGSFTLPEDESDMGSMPMIADIDSVGLPILRDGQSAHTADVTLSQSVNSADDYLLLSNQHGANDLLKLPNLFTERQQGDGSSTSSDQYQFPAAPDENLSVAELKQALISVMLKKEDIEEERRSLQSRLVDEEEFNKGLKEELANVRQEYERKLQLDSDKIKSLQKDNELLRNQLKKYITAVQLLQHHGPDAKNLGIHHSDPQPLMLPSKLEEEASSELHEYKNKLIQVAEMHGELMEFIEYIQRKLKFNEDMVKKLAIQLTELRGPLPIAVEAYLNSTTAPSEDRPWQTLVNIWIPSVFLKGSESSPHHVYQVFLRIKDDEWNVYRRYSQFYKFWKQLKAKHSLISTFDFPPKKALGRKDGRLVEDRRRRLQDFLRNAIQHIISQSSQTSITNRQGLVDVMPFFGDNLTD